MLKLYVTIFYLLGYLFIILFQIGLLIGKPWGEYTMGGYTKGVLPVKLRIAPFISILILTSFIIFTIDISKIFDISLNLPIYFKWVAIGFNGLAFFVNSITRSQKERKLWQPITLIMLIASIYIFNI